MKVPASAYSFSVLRYVHDVVSAEFVNIGVLVYSPSQRFLDIRCSSSYSRTARFFGGIDGTHYRALVRHIEDSVAQIADYYCNSLSFSELPSSIEKVAEMVLSPDDSALQFSPRVGGGVAGDMEATIRRLYERYVELHIERSERQRADDDHVLMTFKSPLRERKVLPQLRAKRIESPVYSHEFPLAWKNGVWNVCEPISFDLVEGGSIVEKANHWAGRALTLKQQSQIDFKMYLLLGKPSSPDLFGAFANAESILRGMPVDHEIFRDDRASSFADLVTEELREHPQNWEAQLGD
jgi:hypothetical protein